jgi:hypothetical protein
MPYHPLSSSTQLNAKTLPFTQAGQTRTTTGSPHISINEIKSDGWMQESARYGYAAAVDADPVLTQEQKQIEKEWAVWDKDNAEGMFHNSTIALGDEYEVVMSNWKVRDD